ncbi:postacrosomal sheath WW domain-binding protein [Nannospalax galili]|uniref:postacrosomal sheath WW domain-binding protein n=1 Tax=Nannospalax galili TaxID=1026970 RepID=UPI00111C7939|nr:postacrosomal sheath WW domain-binding protein [Nannospalax galili]
MAVNQNHSADRRGVAIPRGESVLKQSSDVELSFPQPPQGSNLFSSTKRGTLFLTSYRVIFVTSCSDNDPMLSFMMPFNLMSNFTVEQPVFGANYIRGTIQAAPNGGWQGTATFKIVFRKGGAIEFAHLMTKAVAAAAQGVPLGVPSCWISPAGIYVITGEQSMCIPQTCQALQVAVCGGPPAGYGAPPPGYGAPPPAYRIPPGSSSPPGYQVLPAGFGVPPPGYRAPPQRYGSPPPEYGARLPGSGTTPGGSGSPPPGYEALPVGYGAHPSGHESIPPGSRAPPPLLLPLPPSAGSQAGHPSSAAAQIPEFQASLPSTSSLQTYPTPSKM